MKRSEGIKRLSNQLKNIYSEQTIDLEPTISGSTSPDIVVYRDEDQCEPFLIIEYTDQITYRRHKRLFEQFESYFQYFDCDYGAIITSNFAYVFERSKRVPGRERSLGGFPPITEDLPPQRSVQTPEEVHFLINRVMDLSYWWQEEAQYHDDIDLTPFYQPLLQKLMFNEIGLESAPTKHEEFSAHLKTVNKLLETNYKGYSEQQWPDFREFTITVFNVFNGYSFDESKPQLVNSFYDHSGPGLSSLSKYRTKEELIDPIIRFAEIKPGMTVLDPAAGFGDLIRNAVETTDAKGHGVEVDQLVVNGGLFFSALSGIDIEYVCDDFLDISRNSTKQKLPGPNRYDRVLVDPPVGINVSKKNIPDFEYCRKVPIEEAIIANSLELLKENGVMVAVVPEKLLAAERSQTFREYLLENYTIESLVTFNSNIYSGAESKAGILKIVNQPPPENNIQQISVATVKEVLDRDLEETLNNSLRNIEHGEHKWMRVGPRSDRTLLPKQVLGQSKIRDAIENEYGSVTQLKEVASEIVSGAFKPQSRTGEDDIMVQYLSPSDFAESTLESRLVSAADAEVTAGEKDILVKAKGKPLVAHQPDTQIVPSTEWAIIRFDSIERANAYLEFFQSEFAKRAIDANRRGSIVPYITIWALRELPVPLLEVNVEEEADD